MNDPWRRWTAIVAASGLSILGLFIAPTPAANPPELPGLGADPYVVCPVGEAGGGFSSRLGVSSWQAGTVRVIGGGGGPVEVPGDGAFFTEVGDLAELGTTPILVETAGTAATYSRAGTVAAVSGCVPGSRGSVAVMGMSTAEGDGSTMVLVNPFASPASVRLAGASEFGVDTPTDLEEVTVPPSTSVELVLDQSMAGRQSLSFGVVADAGLVVAGMKRSGPSDVATSEAVAASTQWFFALPDFGFDGSIHLRSLSEVDTAYRIDRIQPDGVVEGVGEGTLVAQSLEVIPVENVAGPGSGVIVSAVEPVAAAIVYTFEGVRAVTPGITQETARWSVPVTAVLNEGQATVWILNTSGQALTATIERIGVPAVQTAQLPPGMTTGVFVTGARGGAIEVSANGNIVVFYGVLSGSSIAIAAAVPVG
ncbi:MAG TPA: DUF5719 family protein [Acidimicrobiia bacterium]|nr:DUF5719 family protein [Acidimicrobiia bacterium]